MDSLKDFAQETLLIVTIVPLTPRVPASKGPMQELTAVMKEFQESLKAMQEFTSVKASFIPDISRGLCL